LNALPAGVGRNTAVIFFAVKPFIQLYLFGKGELERPYFCSPAQVAANFTAKLAVVAVGAGIFFSLRTATFPNAFVFHHVSILA